MEKAEKNANRELTITRILDAPGELVWKVWTKSEPLAEWWGPKEFTNPVCEWEAKPGNKILVHMKGPDGTVHPMDGEFIEVTKPSKLVFISAALDEKGKRLFEVLSTVTFTEEGAKTMLNLHFKVTKMVPEAEIYISGMKEGWNQSLDKLEEYLTK